MKYLTRRLIAALLALVLLLSLAACAAKKDDAPSKSTGKLPTSTEKVPEEAKPETPDEKTKPDENAATPEKDRGKMENKEPIGGGESGSPAEQVTIERLRASMAEFPKAALAVAYIGYFNDGCDMEIGQWVEQNAPAFAAQYPFVQDIPQERIVGDDWGEVYCLVPRDDATSLAINSITWTWDDSSQYPSYEVEDILYRTDYAEPMLLVVGCDEELFTPTIEISAVADNGTFVSWTPELFEGHGVMDVPFDEEYDDLIYDFSLYSEDWAEAGDDWWLPPTEAGLMDTVWLTDDGWALAFTCADGSESGEDTGFLKLYYQIGGTYVYYCDADWEIVDDMLVMGLFSGSYSILGAFYILIDPSGENLYLSQETGGTLFYDENGPANPTELEDPIYPSFFGREVTSAVLTLYSGGDLVFKEG